MAPKEPLVQVDEREFMRDGNVFVLMGKCRAALRRGGFRDEADELSARVTDIGKGTPIPDGMSGYDAALQIMFEYVELYDEERDGDEW